MTLQEAITGANMTIKALKEDYKAVIKKSLDTICEGTCVNDGDTFYIHAGLRDRNTIKEAMELALKAQGVKIEEAIEFGARKAERGAKPTTRLRLKEDVIHSKQEAKTLRISEARFNKNIKDSIATVLDESKDILAGMDIERARKFVTNEAYRRTLAEGTSNFCSICADHVNVIMPEEDEDGNEQPIDWNFVKWDVKDALKEAGFDDDTMHDHYPRENRSYPAETLGCSLDVDFDCTKCYLIPLLVSGYYEGASLDFDIFSGYYGSSMVEGIWLSEYGDVREFVTDVIEDCLDAEEGSDEFNTAVDKGIAAVEAAIEKFNQASAACTKAYNRAASFSNGETMYTPVNQE